ncbi:MAG: hypothetical protein GX638_00155, partial [Crenarchaeota archaeon]|nr:hypothetical protein [Thermoproteota archaeon]
KDAIGLKTKSQVSKTSFEEDLAIVTEEVKEDLKEVKKEFKGVAANSKKTKKSKKA